MKQSIMQSDNIECPQGEAMYALARRLWPIPRSLSGDGVARTLDILSERNPELTQHSFKSGAQVFDWEVPKQWEINDAYLEHESGRRFAEFKKNNLHVLGYSAPLDRRLSKIELQEIVYTQPDQTERIPYVTSYYKERSGFCLSQSEFDAMPEGDYRAIIDSTLFDGEIVVADCRFPGVSADEIVFSTYICHPSMANNEWSGPVLAEQLCQKIRGMGSSRYFSYRLLFLVETIGSIAYLSRFLGDLKAHCKAGFVLSCVGDERAYSHVESRWGDTLADHALRAALIDQDNLTTYSFLKRGSDERQFCSPGIDLPFCGYCRSKYGEYPEYHTDADNLDLISPKGLQESYDVMSSIVDAFEMGRFPRTKLPCEPQLGKRGLYPTISQKGQYADIRLRMDALAYADGKTDVFDIAKKINVPLNALNAEFRVLCENGLVSMQKTPATET